LDGWCQYVSLGVFISNSDGSLVLATYGKISSEFNDLESGRWLLTASMLAGCAAQPLVSSSPINLWSFRCTDSVFFQVWKVKQHLWAQASFVGGILDFRSRIYHIVCQPLSLLSNFVLTATAVVLEIPWLKLSLVELLGVQEGPEWFLSCPS
jgi:hypothetical protein